MYTLEIGTVSEEYQRYNALAWRLKSMRAEREIAELLPAKQVTMTQVDRMMLYGGSFANAIGKAWHRADDDNRRKLEEAFADLFQAYAEPRE